MERDEMGRFSRALGVLHGCHCWKYVVVDSHLGRGSQIGCRGSSCLRAGGSAFRRAPRSWCARPVRLVGSTTTVDTTTGRVAESYASADELDGCTYLRCGNRRAAAAGHPKDARRS